ncbi:MAG: glycosyltransferase family 39 protein [Planctomycetes bacterium]|nr:glycosyltransferase family 39 protein [Planctomycetota bacterium]
MLPPRQRWCTYAVLALGVALRIAVAVVTPPERAYDDHFAPLHVILDQGRIPDAADCWECFQPPLYYVVSAGVYAASMQVAEQVGAEHEQAVSAGRKAVQFVSVVAGAVTLWLCLLILRRMCELSPGREALVLACVGVLPRHVYMSAMATNDAFTYMVASIAIYAALSVQAGGWTTRGCLVAGALAGAAVLSKGYGAMTVLAIAGTLWLFTHAKARRLPKHEYWPSFKPVAWVLVGALAVGVWPTVRNLYIFDEPHVDNYDIFDTPMRFQPPGSIWETEFYSFRLSALLKHPWVHLAHVDSFWTELYARLWFDYEGFAVTLKLYPPWDDFWHRVDALEPVWNARRQRLMLDYGPQDVPPDFRWVAVAGYLAGLPITAALLAGLVLALRRFRRDPALALLTVHFLAGLFVVVFQTLRLPHFAAMKAAFALSGLTTAPVLLGLALEPLRGVGRYLGIGLVWLAVSAVAAADVAYLIVVARYAAGP